ncbi:hypothetical protein ACEPAI_1378 [Sanghuangporus weigelae]
MTDIYTYSAFGTNLTWNWRTELGRGITGGNTLGGSTSINGDAGNEGAA